ncbi:hypothetical protein [Protaetiibacter mangrovi]|uniref:Histidine kinase n=1 Tax=Protaetiibacter mangrovi TaxID=2970926 RepID=A0ABT1ZI84_9MICO|nr:hypothetical protein [Protaetiibacter mangrovi]MCS0500290.1 hypothetical protein [Protaetiibacter mangrovi]TPX04999.1 hypothetical protein FJ656_08895 [Schumannella luteola]
MAQPPLDPTRMRDQPALTSSRGLSWLVLGGLLTLIALGVLVPMAVLRMPPFAVPGTAAVVVAVLYLCMIIVRFATPPSRLRLALLAVDMLAIAFVTLLAVLLVAERATLT